MDSGAIVEVVRTSGLPGKDAEDTDLALLASIPIADLQERVQNLEQTLNACQGVMGKMGKVVTPWTLKKNRKASDLALSELQEQRDSIGLALRAMLGHDEKVVRAARELSSKIASKDMALSNAAAENTRLVGELAGAKAAASDLEKQLAELQKEVAKKDLIIKETKRKVEVLEVATGSGAVVVKCKDEHIAKMQAKVDAAEADKAAALAAQEKQAKEKQAVQRKLDALRDEYQGTADIAEREIRRLKAELKKAQEATSTVKGEQEVKGSEALNKSMREQRSLQRRYDSMKQLADHSKEAALVMKQQAEEAMAAQAKAVEQAELHAKRAAEAKAAREAVLGELELVRSEHVALRRLFFANGGGEAQAAQLREFVNASAPWPRHVYTSRSGCCLHSRTVCSAVDINRVQAMAYESHAELEAVLIDQKMVLCSECGRDGGF